MICKFALAAIAAASCAQAAAEDAVAVDGRQEARAQLTAAIAAAEAIGEKRWAFTLSYADLAENADKTYVARFDPRLPSGARWRAVSPTVEKMSKDERKAYERIAKNDDADEGLVYDSLSRSSDQAQLIEASEIEASFSLPIDDPETPEAVRTALALTVKLDRAAGHIASIEVRSQKPFKPMAVAKVDFMRQVQNYAPVGPGGAVLLVSSQSDMKGKAMFKEIRSEAHLAYSEFEAVDAPPRAPKKD